MRGFATTSKRYEVRNRCRICDSPDIEVVLELGAMPLTAAFRHREQLSAPELRVPLSVAHCPECSLVQLLETVPAEEMFCRDYPYYSSYSPALLEHSRRNALRIIESRKLCSSSLVVEVASNDGYLLRTFVEQGIPAFGIDPAEGQAHTAELAGVPTICKFFTVELAKELAVDQQADVIIANNVLAHVPDLHGFVEGIRLLLRQTGVAILEVPYVVDLVQNDEFDTIYHEHLCYYSLSALDHLFRSHGLFVNDVERLSIHGGSIRIYVESIENSSTAVRELLGSEAGAGVDTVDYYRGFAARVRAIRSELCQLIDRLKRNGASIAGYGAAAKGIILINYVGMGRDQIDFVVDRNLHKQGMYLPGQAIPVFGPERLLRQMPGYVLLLAWNFAEEILGQQAEYRRRGGRFIVPIPKPRVV